MKKILVSTFIFLGILGVNSYADIDLDAGYSGNLMLGYRGAEIRGNYYSVNHSFDEKTKEYGLKNLDIRNNLEELSKYLEKDNKEVENLFSVGYKRFNSNFYKNNNYSVLLGRSSSYNSRAGLKFNFTSGKINNHLTEKDYALNLFYNQNPFTIISYIGQSKIKALNNNNRKNIYYGIYGKWEKEIPEIYIGTPDYLLPSVYTDIQAQRFTNKSSEALKIKNDSLNTTVGLKFKNEMVLDYFKITTNLKTGYNREFLVKRKYGKNIKDPSPDTLITGIEVNIKYNEFLDLYGEYILNKSLNTSNYNNITSVGIQIRL